MIYLDSNVFILAQIDAGKEGRLARLILHAMEEGRFRAVTNVLAVDEIAWVIKKEVDYACALKVGKGLFELLNLDVIEVSPRTLRVALDIMEKYYLKPRDAVHADSMIERNVRTIVTQDLDFKKVKGIKALKFSEFLRKVKV